MTQKEVTLTVFSPATENSWHFATTPLVSPWKKRVKRFNTDDMLLPRSGWCFWLHEANFQPIRVHCFLRLPATLKPGVSVFPEDFQFVLRETNLLESGLSGKLMAPHICDWRSGGKRKILAFLVIFCCVLRMTLSGTLQTPTGTALMDELGQGKFCWTVTTIQPLADDWWFRQHAQTSTRSGIHNSPARCWLKRWNSMVDQWTSFIAAICWQTPCASLLLSY